MTYNLEFLNSISPDIIPNICTVLKCSPEEIFNIEPMKIGLTNVSFSFFTPGGHYVYRYPGEGTDNFISRQSEAFSESVAASLGLDDSLIFIDAESGWKLSRYVENYRYIDPYDERDRKAAMAALKKLHQSGIVSKWDFDYVKEACRIASLSDFQDGVDFEPWQAVHKRIQVIGEHMDDEGFSKVLCHNDAWHWNMLMQPNEKITLIDWEYSGNSYPQADVAYFTASLDYSIDDYLALATLYEGRSLSQKELRFYLANMAAVMWYWFVWALYEEYLGTKVDDKAIWLSKALQALNLAEEMFIKEEPNDADL